MSSQIRVCVIGAGAAGVCAARHLSKPNSSTNAKGGAQELTKFLPVVYEKSDTKQVNDVIDIVTRSRQIFPKYGDFCNSIMAISGDISEIMPMKTTKFRLMATNTWKQDINHNKSGKIWKSKVARHFVCLLPIAPS